MSDWMDPVVERVARAMFRFEHRDSPAVLKYEDDEWPGYVPDARAALDASPLGECVDTLSGLRAALVEMDAELHAQNIAVIDLALQKVRP